MNTRYSRVSGNVGPAGTRHYVGANGSRVAIEFGASYSGGYCYAEIYVDSVISGNFIGSIAYFNQQSLRLDIEEVGDLVQRRFAILKVSSSGAGANVGVIETIETSVSGG